MDTIKTLESQIRKYAESYYSGVAEVSDAYFDELVEKLRKLDPDNKLLHMTGWGFSPSCHKERVTHPYNLEVGSLSKYKVASEAIEFFSGKEDNIRISAKLDGLSVVSYYKKGRRTLCLTRGNGTSGLNITEHMDKICPEGKTLDSDFSGAIRGEVCISNETWNNSKYAQDSQNDDSINQRNIAAGLINRDYLEQSEADLLDYVVYKVIASENLYFSTLSSVDNFLDETGLKMVDSATYTFERFKKFTDEEFAEILEGFRKNYPCDGLVFTSNSLDEKEPTIEYNEVAFKFQAESKEVTVTEVTWSATRTGRMAPRVWFNPVSLSGASVQKATGFNAAFIRDNKIGPGAIIEVCRSGEVIPHIMSVISPAEEIILPTECPICGTPLEWNGDDLICIAENESQLAYNFLTWVAPCDGAGWSLYSKIVEGLNLESLDKLCEFLESIKSSGIYPTIEYLKRNSDINGSVTWKKTEMILKKLTEEVDPRTFICSLNIKNLSWRTAESILNEYPEFIKDILNDCLNEEKLWKVPGVGYQSVNIILNSKSRIKRVGQLVNVKDYEKEEKSVSQFKVAITGALSVKRSDFDAELQKRGIEQSGNFKEIKYLITNNPGSTSSKTRKAKESGVEIISEEDFVSKYFN